MPDGVDPNHVDVWFQDETRIGQQGSTTRLWTKKGTRPRAIKQQQFTYAYLYGAVCPARQLAIGLALPNANSECMKAHMQAISDAVPKGRHALVIMDGAGWHQESLDLHNVTLLKLPPYAPELNPCEQVWCYLKEHFLSNRCFADYEAILDAICHSWNQFSIDKERIVSLCTRKWAAFS